MHPSVFPSASRLEPPSSYHHILLELAQSFTEAYRKTKSQRGLLDFADLEQHAIDLLWDRSEEEPTDLARDIQRRYHSGLCR